MKQIKKSALRRLAAGKRIPFTMGVLVACCAGISTIAAAGMRTEFLTVPTIADAKENEQTNRIIVKFSDLSTLDNLSKTTTQPRLLALQEVATRHNVQLSLLRATSTQANVLKLDRYLRDAEFEALAKDIASSVSGVSYAEADRMVVRQDFLPNDPYFPYTSAKSELIKLPAAWDVSTGSGVVVAVLDTGHTAHEDLNANVVPGYDFVSDTFAANDGDGWDADATDPGDGFALGECVNSAGRMQRNCAHGTRMAGAIAAVGNNSVGLAGVAFNAKIQPVRVLGKCGGYTSDLADAITWASGGKVAGVPVNAKPARVISMSLNNGHSGVCSTSLQDAIKAAGLRKTVVVASAGNQETVANFAPANCAGVISVAAVTTNGGRTAYSNYGGNVAIAAPGGNWATMYTGGAFDIMYTLDARYSSTGYGAFEGTSIAAAQVSGVAALMLSKNLKLTPAQVKTKLQASASAVPAACEGCGSGIVDAAAAVAAATKP